MINPKFLFLYMELKCVYTKYNVQLYVFLPFESFPYRLITKTLRRIKIKLNDTHQI